ncbi:polysaccharide biosynthesis C-terminal domain-containing protein [Vibrio maerlii]|uniref:oligosaccharide flippase family protein n=1 Tax=Vibrio maerlii TaxID=2231648 RepID=UPI000E3BC978|nr:polysaccharide biosynthesis C-terminal domain-containing protein [Vibrio maerlii]
MKWVSLSTLTYSFERYWGVSLSSIFFFYFAAKVSTESVALFAYYQAILAILSAFALQCLDPLIQRELVSRPEDRADILGGALLLKFVSLVVFLVVISLILIFTNAEQAVLLLIMGTAIVFSSFKFISSTFNVAGKHVHYMVLGVLGSTVAFLYKLLVLHSSDTLTLYATFFVADSFSLCVLYWGGAKFTSNTGFTYNKNFMLHLFREGRFLILSSFVLLASARIDQLVVGTYGNSVMMANYAMAVKCIGFFVLASSAFNLGYAQKLNKNTEQYRQSVRALLSETFVAGTIMTLLGAVVSAIFLNYVFGDKYPNAYQYALGLSPIIFFSYFLSSTGRILVVEGLTKVAFKRNVYALTLNALLSFWLMKIFGVYGVIVASVLSLAFGSVLFLVIDREARCTFKGLLYDT